ncbi:MAG: diguanylate cyclase [Acidobacteria bacterium]|nr:diguanylate cyclase [Acidobacteriota bacterium]
MAKARILIVEDDDYTAEALSSQLEYLDYTVAAVVTHGEEAIEKTIELQPDLVLMDIKLKGQMDGIEAAKQIRNRLEIPLIFLTGYADDELLQRAKLAEPAGYIVKPVQGSELHASIQIALYRGQVDTRLRQTERRLAATLKSIGDAVIATGPRGRITFMNPVAEALTGWSQSEALGRDVTHVFRTLTEGTLTEGTLAEGTLPEGTLSPVQHTDQAGEEREDIVSRSLLDRTTVELPARTILRSRDGRSIAIGASASAIQDGGGGVTGAVLVFRDVTEHRQAEAVLRRAHDELEKQVQSRTAELARASEALRVERAERKWAEEALRESEDRFRVAMKHSPVFVFNQDRNLRYTWVYNPQQEFEPEAIIGKTDADLLPPEQASRLTEIKRRTLDSGIGTRQETPLTEADRTFYCDLIVEPLRNEASEVIGITGASVDVTDRKHLEDRLRGLSLVDELTGLYNRRGFMKLAELQLKIANRARSRLLQIFADVDGLKQINDRFGHEEGDLALIEVARVLRQTFRESDVLARIGGDEFAILAADVQDGGAKVCAARLRDKLETHNLSKPDRRYRLSVSVGIAHYDPAGPCSIEELLSRSDALMYENKRGKGYNDRAR